MSGADVDFGDGVPPAPKFPKNVESAAPVSKADLILPQKETARKRYQKRRMKARSTTREPLRVKEDVRPDPRETGSERRMRRAPKNVDPFYIPPELIPPGMSWQWKRYENMGKVDHSYMQNLLLNGWDYIQTKRLPTWMPADTSPTTPVNRDGLVLMERPLELTLEAEAEEYRAARNQVRQKEEALVAEAPPGTLERVADKRVSFAKKEYERIEVPTE